MIAYFEGVHGSGKTRIVNSLKKNKKLNKKFEKIIVYEEITVPENIKMGGSVKGELYFLNYYHKVNKVLLNKNNNNTLFLIDRHPINIKIYGQVFLELNKITSHEYNKVMNKYENSFEKIAEGKIFHLKASVETLKNRILKRNRNKNWNETDWEYLRKVHEKYEEWCKKNNIIITNTDNKRISDVEKDIIKQLI